MGNFKFKSILLGIGIGIILTSLLNMIYIAGNLPKKELTDDEIIKQAEKLGMVQASSIIDGFNIEQSTTPHKKLKPDGK